MKSGMPSTPPSPSPAPQTKTERVLFLIIAKPFFLGLHACTPTAGDPFPSVWRLSLSRSLLCLARDIRKGVLWHSIRRGRKHSLPTGTAGNRTWITQDLSGHRPCLPSCQAALSQTRCERADNKFRKRSVERSREKKQRGREMKKKRRRQK